MKKKTLAKSSREPKKLIKTLMNKEGGLSSMKIHECREMLKDLAEELVVPTNAAPLRNEFIYYLAYTAERLYGEGSVSNIEFWITWNTDKRTDKAGIRQFKAMKAAQDKAAFKRKKAKAGKK